MVRKLPRGEHSLILFFLRKNQTWLLLQENQVEILSFCVDELDFLPS